MRVLSKILQKNNNIYTSLEKKTQPPPQSNSFFFSFSFFFFFFFLKRRARTYIAASGFCTRPLASTSPTEGHNSFATSCSHPFRCVISPRWVVDKINKLTDLIVDFTLRAGSFPAHGPRDYFQDRGALLGRNTPQVDFLSVQIKSGGRGGHKRRTGSPTGLITSHGILRRRREWRAKL